MYSSVPSHPYPGPAPSFERHSPTPASPTSPTRPGRLRGLSYLRSYTQNHILSRESHSGSNSSQQRPAPLIRASSYPSPTSTSTANRGSALTSPAAQNSHQQISPAAQRSTTDLESARSSNPEVSTSGWLPTVGGHSGFSRITTETQATTAATTSAALSGNSASAFTQLGSDITASMARTRSATVGVAMDVPHVDGGGDLRHRNEAPVQNSTTNGHNVTNGMSHQLPSIRFCSHQDPRAQRPSLVFSPMARVLPTGKEVIRVGRYSERDNQPAQAANVPSSAPVGFKSKVVSRRHCEFWCSGGRWFIKDVKSSSGTFLNHIRLSSPGTESKPFPVNDGDIVQLGIDFKGGEEMIFRCVKIRVELNKGWQTGPSSFNVQSHKRLRELNNQGKPPTSGTSQDCSICLGPIAPCQSLFVAPCSHTWHYKCIRVMINGPHWPHFICPNCRSVADLEAELDDPSADGVWEEADTSDVKAPVQPSDSAEPVRAARGTRQPQNNPEATHMPLDRGEADPQHKNSVPSDGEMADASDDSETSHGVHHATEQLDHLNMEEPPSSSSSSNSQQGAISSSTVAPVDIISRKPVAGSSSRLEQPASGPDRDLARTPSPNRLPSSLADGLIGPEGPMTPRNDAGPFLFDGSAGRAAEPGLEGAKPNLNGAAATALPQPEPQTRA